MRSIRTQLIFLCIVLFSTIGISGYLNSHFIQIEFENSKTVQAVDVALQNHAQSAFYNEEVRVLAHSTLALYDFTAEERLKSEGATKSYSGEVKSVAASYAKRSIDDSIKINVAGHDEFLQPLLVKHRTNLKKYHDLIAEKMTNPPKTKEGMIAGYGELNVLRAAIGASRREVTGALEAIKLKAVGTLKQSEENLQKVLLATFFASILAVGGFALILFKQFGGFGASVAKAIANIHHDIPSSLKNTRIQEFKLVADALEQMQEQTKLLEIAKAKDAESQSQQQEKLSAFVSAVADFKLDISANISTIDGAVSSMNLSASELIQAMQGAQVEADSFSKHSALTKESVSVVSSANNEMAASIRSLSDRLRNSFDNVLEASRIARDTSRSVGELDQAAQRIEEVVTLIRSIAEQTNLLALNATIEAARAGEAGRGFSVVATEVKELASRTSHATSEIASQIIAIQSNTKQAVSAIREISSKINEAEMQAQEMSSVLEQQDQSVRDVADTALSTLQHTREMHEGSTKIGEQIATTRSTAVVVEEASMEVQSAARNIDQSVSRFLEKVAA